LNNRPNSKGNNCFGKGVSCAVLQASGIQEEEEEEEEEDV
jgi:hypothetical protein